MNITKDLVNFAYLKILCLTHFVGDSCKCFASSDSCSVHYMDGKLELIILLSYRKKNGGVERSNG